MLLRAILINDKAETGTVRSILFKTAWISDNARDELMLQNKSKTLRNSQYRNKESKILINLKKKTYTLFLLYPRVAREMLYVNRSKKKTYRGKKNNTMSNTK